MWATSSLSHPFALGLDVLEDYYGGKGYILFLQAPPGLSLPVLVKNDQP